MNEPARAEAAPEQGRILANGDAAMVVEFGDRIDLTLNERVLALADRFAAASISGIVETVPTFRSLMISFDPSRIGFDALARRVSGLLADPTSAPRAGRRWRLPVCYDREFAPDLDAAASRTGMAPEAFVSRHSGMIHHVYMLGFLPGQPYLGDLPAELALPRRETPRTRIAAGSVGVASRMTCIFPKETPCGLHIIGRTPVALWDHRRREAALLAPGDRVVFEPVGIEDFARLAALSAAGRARHRALRRASRGRARALIPALRILAPGLMTTLQDLGRVGYQRLGIPVGGALDALSLRAANLLVGNPPDVGGLEIIASGPTFAVEAESARVAFVGAAADLVLTRQASPSRSAIRVGQSALLYRGDSLRAGSLKGSSTLYMAVEGGFDIAPVMGSVSTYLRGGFGGWRGRALEPGDCLPLKTAKAPERVELSVDAALFAPPRRFRVLEGPQSDHFSKDERAAFFRRDYVVGPDWNRMGMRLISEPLKPSRGYNVTSDGVVRGSIQIPGDGLPIVLLAEHQTTGGYPKIGAVISADLPALGRLGAGSKLAFERVSREEAEAARRAHAALIERLPSSFSSLDASRPLDLPARLGEANLVSGVIDACAWMG